MKRLTKYKDGKFLLNHSSMNEAIDKLGIYELVDELNATKLKNIIQNRGGNMNRTFDGLTLDEIIEIESMIVVLTIK